MRLVNLYFLSHTHHLFYKPSLLPRKCISWIKNDTVEKIWTHHTKHCPGEIKAQGQLWKTRFLSTALCLWWSVHPTPIAENLVNFSENRGWRARPPGKGKDFLPGTSLHVLSDSELGTMPIAPLLQWYMTGPSLPLGEGREKWQPSPPCKSH